MLLGFEFQIDPFPFPLLPFSPEMGEARREGMHDFNNFVMQSKHLGYKCARNQECHFNKLKAHFANINVKLLTLILKKINYGPLSEYIEAANMGMQRRFLPSLLSPPPPPPPSSFFPPPHPRMLPETSIRRLVNAAPLHHSGEEEEKKDFA